MFPDLSLFELLTLYGLTFGFMNKVPLIHNKISLLDKLLKCSYCVGFHAGWIYYWMRVSYESHTTWDWWHALCWGMMSAAWCYVADTAIQKIEDLNEN